MLNPELDKAYVRLFLQGKKKELESARNGSILHTISLFADAIIWIDDGKPDFAKDIINSALSELIGIYMVKEEPNE